MSQFAKAKSWLFTIPLATLVTASMISLAVASSLFSPDGRWQQFLAKSWASMVLHVVGIRLRVRGAENLQPGSHSIVVSNHLSLMDTPVLVGALPVAFKFLAKRELLKVPFIGWHLRRGGHLTVDRSSIRSALESMNECARLIRDRHLSVLIFPEGTRGTGELQPFKDGAAFLAIQSGALVTPVAIVGTERALPTRSSVFTPTEVEVRIGVPIDPAGLQLKQRGEFSNELHRRVSTLLRLHPDVPAGADPV